MQTLCQIDIQNKRVIIREDFNVPMKDGHIMNAQRLQAALPTIKAVLEKNAAVILLSHLGRPQEGVWEEKFSLKPIANYLSEVLSLPVRFEKEYLSGINIQPGEVVLCENVRFNPGEKANDAALCQKMAKLGDVFVMDAFATAHRAEASTCGIMTYLPSVSGPLLQRELAALSALMENPQQPLTAIVGGAKVSDKLLLLKSLVQKVDNLIIGGGIANTFLAASGFPVGESLYEPALIEKAQEILELAKQYNCHIPLPKDVIVAESLTHDAKTTLKSIHDVSAHDKIFDIGPETAEILTKIIHQSKTILWNGPVGVFEMPPFAEGTKAIAEAIASSSAFSVAGGGDTLSAVEIFGIADKISYLSTGGGAFLEYVEGKVLPAIEALS
jgi:phosphoglycerate kinase